MRRSSEALAPRCPFCNADLKRPETMSLGPGETAQGGTCACGAIYLVDATGKNVGGLMVQALNIASETLAKRMEDLLPDEDYADAILNYDWRTHRSYGVSPGYMDGSGRMYVLKVNRKAG